MRVKGEGPLPNDLMFIGEGPGKVESQVGGPFKGPAGGEMNRYLNGYHLPLRADIYITNLYKEWASGAPIKSKEPTLDDLVLSEWELFEELKACQPAVVATLGRWSTRWFLGNVDMESVHGLVFPVAFCPFCHRRWRTECAVTVCETCSQVMGTVVVAHQFFLMPVVHPAAGLHQPVMAAQTAYDFAQLSGLLHAGYKGRWDLCWFQAPPGVYHPYGAEMGVAGVLGPAHLEMGLDTEGSVAAPWGFSISAKPGTGYVQRHLGTPLHLDPGIRWVCHHYMHDKKVIEAMGGEIPEDNFDDTMVMAYNLGIEPQALKALAHRHLGRVRPDFMDIFSYKVPTFSAKTGKKLKKEQTVIRTMDEVWDSGPEGKQTVIDYAGADADDVISLKPILWKKLEALDLTGIYEIDRRCLPIYARMEQVGLPINMDHMVEFGKWLADEIEVKTILLQADWPDLNPGSPDQVAAIMFDVLKLPGGKKTPVKGRYSTNDKIMEALKPLHPFVPAIIEWRELSKTKNTFIDPIGQYVHDGRLFFELLATRVISGRLGAKNPNVLAFPKYTELGKRFRRGIEAPPGRLLGSWDLNQIELRVLALDSGSATLLHAFDTGEDLHTRTARKVFGLPDGAKEAPAQRVAAKAVNFSIPMGTTEIGLAEQMRKNQYSWPELQGKPFATDKGRKEAQAKVCRDWIDTVIADWGIAGYISQCHADARRYGYIRSRGGRIRFLPSVLSSNKQIKEAAQREAQAYGPQAGARWFMKQIEYKVWTEVIKPLKGEGHWIEPVLDIHDDLILEFDAGLGPMLLPVIESLVVSSFEEGIPITAKGAVGKRLSDI